MTPLLADTVYDTPGLDALSAGGGWPALLGALAFAAAAVAVVAGWRERQVTPNGWGWLLTLRLGAIAAVVALLVGLERRLMTEREEPSRVVLLVDSSASMRLPMAEEASTRGPRNAVVRAIVDRLAVGFATRHAVGLANFDVTVEYAAAPSGDAADPSMLPPEALERAGASTRLGTALGRVLADYASTPLAALVVVSDGGGNAGPDPATALAVASERGVPVHTLGVGPLRQPPSVGFRDLAAPSRASVGDRFRVNVTLASNAAALAETHTVTVSLRRRDESGGAGRVVFETDLRVPSEPGGGLAIASAEVEAAEPGEYELRATLSPAGRDADPRDNLLVATVTLVEEPTRVLLVAGGPTRDYRFLRDQLFRDDAFTCDVLLQSAAGAVTQDADTVLQAPPSDAEGWDAYDTVVAIDVDWERFAEDEIAALAAWVSRGGGGMVFSAGPVFTPSAVRRGLPDALRTLLPVALRDDPLAFSVAIEASREARPVRPTPSGRDADFLQPPADQGWDDFDGLYATPLPSDVKPGATVLARLGDRGDESPPLVVEHFYGAGRVAYVAAAETWRLRQATPDWFVAWHASLLRRVSQGRVRGAAAEGSLLLDRSRYDLGEAVTLRYVARSPDSARETVSLIARIDAADADPEERGLAAVEGQAGVYATTFRASAVGTLAASLTTPAGERLGAEAQVTLPSLEEATVVQDVAQLRSIAEQTGGRYLDLGGPGVEAALDDLVAATPSLSETTVELGPPDERFTRRIANTALGVMAGCLLLEWVLRRSWRLA